ncbi:hypothetical protein N7E81_13550 [Reichenbachiella carrageenanivorans]|uniref:Uncharacterized protein n=1 Tax=Reichenbachiella carrageenanivorans TaxID=2979869 RepID=A0ABY6CWT8_9BACT|nr:hypothetical protein [Reichenbachiella carrageenanivorans]UXX78381.1 hypothetical protein N7E81_13550 [Reichenbachiella carrageenanivorans]
MEKSLFRHIVLLSLLLLGGVSQLSACTEQESYVQSATIALEGAGHASFNIVHEVQHDVFKSSIPLSEKEHHQIEVAEKEVEESETSSSKKHAVSSDYFTSISSDLILGYFHCLRSRQAFYNSFSHYTVFKPIYVVLGVFRL